MDNKEMGAILGGFNKAMDRLGGRIIGAFTRVFGALAARNEEIYWYNLEVDLPAVIAGTVNGVVNVTQEADFVMTKVMAVTFDIATGAVVASPTWEARIRDGSSDRDMMNNPVHAQNAFGTAQRPYIAPKNRLFRRNSSIAVTFTQLSATAGQRVGVAFGGYKIFDEAALNLTVRR